MPDNAEVGIKLVIDDQSAATLKDVQEGLKKTEDHAVAAGKAAQKGGRDGASAWHGVKEAIAGVQETIQAIPPQVAGVLMAIGALVEAARLLKEYFTSGYEIMKSMGEEAIHAASEMQKQEKAMGGSLMMIDRQHHSFKQLVDLSHEIREQFEMTALQTGRNAGDLTKVFDTIIQGGQLGSEAAEKLTKDMATVGKVTRGGMEGLSSAFAQIEHGMASQRNPIVQLISQMGVLKGSAADVAKQMHKMSQAQKNAVAEKAISEMAAKMTSGGGGPPAGLESLSKTFDGLREAFFESMGKPMLDKLLPPLNLVKKFLIDHLETIKEVGEKIGDAFGEGIEIITGMFKSVSDVVRANWGEIATFAHNAAAPFKAAWEFVVDHKDSIAAAFETMAKLIMGAFKYANVIWSALIDKTMFAIDLIKGKGFAEAHDHVASRHADTEQGKLLGAANEIGHSAEFEEALKNYKEKMGEAATALSPFIKHMEELHAASESMATAIDNTAKDQNPGEAFAAMFAKLSDSHNDGAMEYASKFAANNLSIQQALVSGAGVMGTGFDTFIKMLNEKGGESGKKLAEVLQNKGGPVAGVKAQVDNHFSGGIHIKQDFRDQDPDRIALVFRRDLSKHLNAQTQGRSGLPGVI